MYGFQRNLPGPIAIVEIPLEQRDPRMRSVSKGLTRQ